MLIFPHFIFFFNLARTTHNLGAILQIRNEQHCQNESVTTDIGGYLYSFTAIIIPQ